MFLMEELKNCIYISQLSTKSGVVFEDLLYLDGDINMLHEDISDGFVITFETMEGAIVEIPGNNIDFWLRCHEEDFNEMLGLAAEEIERVIKAEETKKGGPIKTKIIDISSFRKNKKKPEEPEE